MVLTGAGISAESGIPTFRDAMDGLWAKFDPEELATPGAFARNPPLVAKWYDERRVRCLSVLPNPGHLALAELERHLAKRGGSFTLLTQNVDRLHHAAGSRNVLELHGSLFVWRCTRCGKEREERGGPFPRHPPLCDCGGTRRPGVVWFGEILDALVLESAYRAIEDCDLFLSVGTSSVVEPAASFGSMAHQGGATVIEINRDPTPLTSRADHALLGKAGEILPNLVRMLHGGQD